MLCPKRTKYRRQHRGRLKGTSRASRVVFGDYGIRALEPAWISSRQIEATRRSIIRRVRRTGRLWIRIYPDKPVTERPSESRMGSGKGRVSHWIAVVRSGAVIFEITGLPERTAVRVLKVASYKLPIKVKFVKRDGCR
jgi:large subunit ribosomal protein L16